MRQAFEGPALRIRSDRRPTRRVRSHCSGARQLASRRHRRHSRLVASSAAGLQCARCALSRLSGDRRRLCGAHTLAHGCPSFDRGDFPCSRMGQHFTKRARNITRAERSGIDTPEDIPIDGSTPSSTVMQATRDRWFIDRPMLIQAPPAGCRSFCRLGAAGGWRCRVAGGERTKLSIQNNLDLLQPFRDRCNLQAIPFDGAPQRALDRDVVAQIQSIDQKAA